MTAPQGCAMLSPSYGNGSTIVVRNSQFATRLNGNSFIFTPIDVICAGLRGWFRRHHMQHAGQHLADERKRHGRQNFAIILGDLHGMYLQ